MVGVIGIDILYNLGMKRIFEMTVSILAAFEYLENSELTIWKLVFAFAIAVFLNGDDAS